MPRASARARVAARALAAARARAPVPTRARPEAWALVGVAALVRRSNGSIAEARVGLTNMGSTPVRARATESALAGSDATAGSVAAAVLEANEARKISAIRKMLAFFIRGT